MRIVVIGLALLLWPVAAHAKPDATGGHTSLGAGNFSCGEWKSDREQKGVKADELAVWMLFMLANVCFWVESRHGSRIAKRLLMTQSGRCTRRFPPSQGSKASLTLIQTLPEPRAQEEIIAGLGKSCALFRYVFKFPVTAGRGVKLGCHSRHAAAPRYSQHVPCTDFDGDLIDRGPWRYVKLRVVHEPLYGC